MPLNITPPPFCDYVRWNRSFFVSFLERQTLSLSVCFKSSLEWLARDHVLICINFIFNSQSPKTRSFSGRATETVMADFNNNLVISTEICWKEAMIFFFQFQRLAEQWLIDRDSEYHLILYMSAKQARSPSNGLLTGIIFFRFSVERRQVRSDAKCESSARRREEKLVPNP